MNQVAPDRTAFRAELRRSFETALIAAAGAGVFVLLKVPAGPVLGALLFTAAAALAGRKLGWSRRVRNLLFLLTGLGAGASVTPAAVMAAKTWPLSLAALVVSTAAMWSLGAIVFARLSRADRTTAMFASAPGALSAVMVLAEEQQANVVGVAVAQTLRISTLVAMAPLALSFGHPTPMEPHAAPLLGGAVGWLVLAVSVLAGVALAHRLRWPVPIFLGAMTGSALVHGTGFVAAALPPQSFQVAAAGIGAVIGSRFSGIRLSDLLRLLPPSLASLVVMAVVGAPLGAAVGWMVGVGPAAGLMAFAPGSMEMMVAVSITLNAHPAYVAAHHLSRTILLLAALPWLARRRQPES
ncbi:AbrB family transcriptional regulator [Phenylobacterium deserti]|nr:AbrB family transcriptional regulator [Phenylobacterium deserti]